MSEPLRSAGTYLMAGIENIKTAKAEGADMSAIIPLLTALVQLALDIVPGLLKRGEFEEAIEEAARELPAEYLISVDIERGSAVTNILLPALDHDDAGAFDVEGTLAEQVRALVKIAKDREGGTNAPRDQQ